MGTPYTRSYPLQLTPLPQDAKQIGGNLNQLGTEANAATLAICVAPSDFWATTMIQSASQVTKHSSVTQSATTIINAVRKCTHAAELPTTIANASRLSATDDACALARITGQMACSQASDELI